MKHRLVLGLVLTLVLLLVPVIALRPGPAAAEATPRPAEQLSLRTATPEEGFALAVRLSRMGVTETQPDREVLHALRPGYAHDAAALIAVSQVVAIHFQTVAAANDYWR